MNEEIKSNYLSIAYKVGLEISKIYIDKGCFKPNYCWGAEGLIYPPLTGLAILNLYKEKKDPTLKKGVEAIINFLISRQFKSGGWPLELGVAANGQKFIAAKEIIEFTSNIEDLPPTAATLRLISEYIGTFNDNQFLEPFKKGIKFLQSFWNPEKGRFDEMMGEMGLKLRAKPENYLIYSFQAAKSISTFEISFERFIQPLYQKIRSLFESCDEYTYPLLYGLHAAIIIQEERDSDYVKSIVKDRIERHFLNNPPLYLESIKGAFGHVDGIRGVTLDEGHLRNSVGVLIAMKFYDKYVESGSFTQTKEYQEILRWVMNMNINGKFHEWYDSGKRKAYGVSSASYFLPINWIIGKI